MKRIAVLGLLLAAPAFAQSPGTVNLIGPSSTPGAPQVTTVATVNSAINTALTAKADAVNGVLTNPAVTGGTISGAPISGASGSFTKLLTVGVSPATAGTSIFSITNTTQPPSSNGLAYEVSDLASYNIPTYGGTIRPRIFETDLNVPTGITSTTIHENFWSSNILTGGGTSGVEINQFHAFFRNNMTGAVTGNVEGFESSAENNGVMGGYQDFLGLFHNEAGGTVTSVYGVKAQLTNDNAAAGSVGSWSGLDCEAMIGSGSHPTFEYCLRNGNPQGAISTNGTVNIGSIAVSTIPLQVIGADQSGATVTQKIIDGGGNRIFEVDNDGTLRTKGSGFNVDGSGNVTAALYKTGVTVGVSCAANTVSLTTLVVTNGIVTHC